MFGGTATQQNAIKGSSRDPVGGPVGGSTVSATERRQRGAGADAEATEPVAPARGPRSNTPGLTMPGLAPSRSGNGVSGTGTFDLSRLTSELGNEHAIVEQFVVDYLALLDGRLERIGSGLERGDHERAVIALLGLESSSSMIGAATVSTLARALLAAVREGRTDEHAQRYSQLLSATERLRADLQGRAVV